MRMRTEYENDDEHLALFLLQPLSLAIELAIELAG